MRDLERRRKKIVDQVRSYAHATFDEMGAASKRETEELIEGVKHIALDEKEISGWEDFCENRLQDMQESAHRLYHEQFMGPLLDELGKTISRRVIEDLDRKFHDENANYKERESYILSVLPKRIEEWRKVKNRRDELVKDPRFTSLTAKHVPKLAAFKDEKQFIDLTYPERKGLVDAVKAALSTLDHLEDRHAEIRAELESWCEQGFMHPSKVGTWMRRIFDGKRTAEQINSYMKQVVRPFAKSWEKARKDFDDLEDAFEAQDTPRGFNRLTLDTFLLLSYKQKTSYLSLAWVSLNDPEGNLEQNKQLAALKLRIRHNLDTGDWEGADEELRAAARISPKDRELLSMHRFLKDHRPKTKKEKKESPDPEKVLGELRDIVRSIPAEIQGMYVLTMSDGLAVHGRFQQLMGNRIWLHEVAGWDEATERKRLAYVHATGKQGKGNLIDMKTQGEDSVLRQVREHANDSAGKTPPNLSADEYWGYWSTLFPSLSYEAHCRIVKGYHYRLKSGLRMLQKLGYRFTMTGSLTPLAGVRRQRTHVDQDDRLTGSA